MDESFTRKEIFIRLIKKAKVIHVFELFHHGQIEDSDIYKEAIKDNRFVVTFNFKHFKKLVQKGRPGIIGLPADVSNEEIDLMLTDFVSKYNPDNYLGKAIKIPESRLNKIKR